MKPLGKFAQSFVLHRKRKCGGPAEPTPKAAHNAPPDVIPAPDAQCPRPLIIPPEALRLFPPVTPVKGFYFDYSRQRERVLDSTSQLQRLQAWQALRTVECIIKQGNGMQISDDHLFEIGYVREPGPTFLFENRQTDFYGVYMSLTGKHIFTFGFRDGGFKEEGRMIELAHIAAEKLAVDENNIALTKTFCKESGNIRVLVTVMSRNDGDLQQTHNAAGITAPKNLTLTE